MDPANTIANPSESSLILRGQHALVLLEHQAQAARLAAEVIQLRSALHQAKLGQVSQLEQWLLDHDQFNATSTPAAVTPLPTLTAPDRLAEPAPQTLTSQLPIADDAETSQSEAKKSSDHEPTGWSCYLPYANQRLSAYQAGSYPWDHSDSAQPSEQLLEQPHHESQSSSHLTSHALDDSLSEDSLSSESLPEHLLPQHSVTHDSVTKDFLTNKEPNWGQHEVTTNLATTEPTNQDAPSFEDTAPDKETALEKQLVIDSTNPNRSNHPVHTETASKPKRTWGSLGISFASHSLLFLALGTITYRHQDDAASLGSQVLEAVPVSHEAPELGAQIELSEPQAPESSDAFTASVPAPAESAFSNLPNLTSSVSVNAAVPPSMAQNIASAVGRSSSAPSPTNSGTSAGKAGSGKTGSGNFGGQFFGAGSGGNFFCYVVDSSGSMRGQAWESAKIELMRSLVSLKPTQQFYIVFFAKEMHAIPDPGTREPAIHGLFATKANIDHARRWIDTVQLSRGGPPTEALAWAINREPDAIYLLTDGVTTVDVCGYVRKVNLIDDIINGQQVRVPIHPIAYHSLDGQQLMRQLAEENKGQFHYVPKPGKP